MHALRRWRALAGGRRPVLTRRSAPPPLPSCSLDGFSLQKGKCVACKTAGCATCPDSPNTCETCLEGQGLVGAKCQACPALPNCTQCDPSNARAVR